MIISTVCHSRIAQHVAALAVFALLPVWCLANAASLSQPSALDNSPFSSHGQPIEPVVRDLRRFTNDIASATAADYARQGITLLLLGGDAAAVENVRSAARESSASGIPVRNVVLGTATDHSGVTVFGLDGSADRKEIRLSKNLSKQVLERIREVATDVNHRSAAMAKAAAAIATAGSVGAVVHCRYRQVLGSRLRWEYVCTTPEQDEQITREAQEWLRRQQDSIRKY